MSYVLQNPVTGDYLTGRSLAPTKDLQKARVFKRIVDAKNTGRWAYDIVEVLLTKGPADGDT